MSTATVQPPQISKDEVAIRELIAGVQRAHYAKDAAGVVAAYAPDATIFDLAPPLAHRGVGLQKKQAWMDTWLGPIEYQSRDLNITVSGDFAFCHGFYQL